MNIKKIIDKRLVLFIPALVMMCVIFSFSSDDAKESSSLSLEVTTDIVEAVDEVVYDNSMDDTTFKDYVKKLESLKEKYTKIQSKNIPSEKYNQCEEYLSMIREELHGSKKDI